MLLAGALGLCHNAPPDRAAAAVDVPAPLATPFPMRSVIDAYTAQAAYASFDEHRKGTLAPGMLADIVILSNDIFQNSPDTLKDTSVAMTIFDGKVVYQHLPATSN